MFAAAMLFLLVVGIGGWNAINGREQEEIQRIKQETQHRIDSIQGVYSKVANS